MKDQSVRLDEHLKRLRAVAVNPYEPTALKEQISAIETKTDMTIAELNLDFLYDNRIFPPEILISKADWHADNRSMQPGDTIVQQIYLPPGSRMSQKIIFGVRVKEIINEEHRKGFSYEALKGHVEKGISIFTVQQLFNSLVFRIHTYSRPGTLISTLMGPIFTDKYQKFCTNKALQNVRKQIEEQNK